MAAPSSPPSIHGDHVGSRNQHDKHLNAEFNSIRDSISQVKHELKEVKDDLKGFKDDANRQFQQILDLTAESLRSSAYMRNSALENPNLPIVPLVTFDLERKAILQPEYFPRNYNQFSSLRDPRTDRQRQMLIYLAKFYEIPLKIGEPSSEDSSNEGDDGDDDDDEVLLDSPVRVVEALEHTLGLIANKFRAYIERAQDLASHPPKNPIKRSQIGPSGSSPKARRQKLELRPAAIQFDPIDQVGKPENPSFQEEQVASVSWDANPQSTPTSEIKTIHGLRKVVKQAKREEGSPTNRGSTSTSELHKMLKEGRSPTNPHTSPQE